ncbi:RNA polymerase II transcriptional coactivator, putative [Trichophyton benhamiae CBS 112371]|uniref:RNA polymerase II transcriptional coactivator, putative n=1 Tax=Arthroderma benhamiae (strain ATCC MYA-4681 / CBS 112371) TaxID=663331 RepID=D4AU42_ARTBC|nr:RNA polymerase II transcriptional coactivator, putative [Trichophyton benhamiae CBS 112371]EFE33312.1 RNA polymerase II transcriptional coactivator, putative [Trichophyton benhamiae CBS 112371]
MGLKRGKRASSEDVEPAVSEDRSKRAKTAGDAGKAGPNAQISATLDKAPKTDSNGDPYWEISRQRRVTISTFKGRVLVNVREYYEKDGQELPGKKFNSLVTLLPEISAVIEQKGGKVTRPDFSESAATVGEEDEEMSDVDEEKSKSSNSKAKKPSPTKNFEATSDEDDDE